MISKLEGETIKRKGSLAIMLLLLQFAHILHKSLLVSLRRSVFNIIKMVIGIETYHSGIASLSQRADIS